MAPYPVFESCRHVHPERFLKRLRNTEIHQSTNTISDYHKWNRHGRYAEIPFTEIRHKSQLYDDQQWEEDESPQGRNGESCGRTDRLYDGPGRWALKKGRMRWMKSLVVERIIDNPLRTPLTQWFNRLHYDNHHMPDKPGAWEYIVSNKQLTYPAKYACINDCRRPWTAWLFASDDPNVFDVIPDRFAESVYPETEHNPRLNMY